MLAQEEKLGPELMFKLHAMAVERDIQILENVLSVQNVVLLPDIEHFNREHISRVLNFPAGEDQGCGKLAGGPPGDGGRESLQIRGRELPYHAQNVYF